MELEYRLRTLEWNSLKGVIGESLARSFIRNILAPKLVKEEGWNQVCLSNNDYKRHGRTGNVKLFRFDHFIEDFIVHGFYANTKLLARYADVVGILTQHRCTPDGLLMKLRKTGRTKKLKESAYHRIAGLRVTASQKHGDILEFPVVDGDLEVVEIKCGRKAKLMSKQKEAYNNLIAKDVPLRMVNVKILSFDRNKFVVEERKFERFV